MRRRRPARGVGRTSQRHPAPPREGQAPAAQNPPEPRVQGRLRLLLQRGGRQSERTAGPGSSSHHFPQGTQPAGDKTQGNFDSYWVMGVLRKAFISRLESRPAFEMVLHFEYASSLPNFITLLTMEMMKIMSGNGMNTLH